ncbi:MAG: DUF1015 domain-containing protein [Bacteroidota bacterium]
MAEIKPLRAWRFNNDLSEEIGTVTSPLFDVVSDKQRENLYKHTYNSIHLSVPSSIDDAAALSQEWKQKSIICQDQLPGIYVYYQYFSLAGQPQEYCRKGFICNIRTYDWEEGVLLRHENTMPSSVNDRIDILNKTHLNVSPTHGLYTDTDFELERYMDESMSNPIYETEDYQGVRDVLSVIHDRGIIERFIRVIKDKQIILADGHHRYEGSLLFRKEMQRSNPDHTGEEGYNFHLMFLTNTEAKDLRILPTHRLIKGLPELDENNLLRRLSTDFIIKNVEDAHTINEVIVGKKWAFGLLFKDSAYRIELKPERIDDLAWSFPKEIKELDLTVLHYFVIEKALGIMGREQRISNLIEFDRSFSDCLAKVIKEEVQLALITNEISMEQVKTVCYSGHTLPQKSTYFYPKVICGFLFGSIQEDEFQEPHYSWL